MPNSEGSWTLYLRILAALAFVSGSIWWSGAVSSRVSALEDWHERASPILQQVLQDQASIESIKDSVHRIDDNINWIVRQMILSKETP